MCVYFQGFTPGLAALSHNDVYQNGTDYIGLPPDPSDVSVNPLFADLAGGNPHLHPASPVRNRGANGLVSDGETDMDGQPRVQDGVVDIGADESDGTAWPAGPDSITRVRPDGSDAADGRTWETAKASIQAAIDATPGGEVWIMAGVYQQPLILTYGVSLYGGFAGTEAARNERDPGHNATILAGGYRDNITAGPTAVGSVVDGLDVRAAFTAIRAYDAALTISNNTIESEYGIVSTDSHLAVTANRVRTARTAFYAAGGTAELARNTLRTYRIAGDCVDLDGGMFLIHDNVLTDGAPYGIHANAAAAIWNNTIVQNGIGIQVTAPGVTLANNVIAFNGWGLSVAAGLSVKSSHNDVVGNATDYRDAARRGPTDVSVDPRLVDIRGGDFHIQPDSPVRDAGDGAYVVTGETDMDGQPRVQNGGVDIGADESDGTVYHPARYVVRVKPEGNDFADGQTWQTAKRTLQAAVDAAQDADVWIAQGLYNENVTLSRHVALYGGFDGTETKREQRDPSRRVATIAGSDPNAAVIFAPAVAYSTVVDGLGIRTSGSGAAIHAASDIVVANNRIAVSSYGVHVTAGAATIRRNRVSAGSYGFHVIGGSAAIHDNEVTDTTNAAVTLNQHGSVWNNTIAGNKGAGIVVAAAGVRLTNNLIADNAGAGVVVNFGDPVLSHNLVFGNSNGNYQGTTSGSGDVSADPLFVRADAGDFRLQPASPAVDAGDDTVVLPAARDRGGKPRIQGAHVDIGAFEVGDAAPLTVADAALALRIAAGLHPATLAEAFRLNRDADATRVDMTDAAAILRVLVPSLPDAPE